MILSLVILFVVLMLVEWGYIVLATRYRIGVTHSVAGREIFTPVGGGWVVVLAAVASVFVIQEYDMGYLWFVAGGVLLGAVSFVDDIIKLSALVRLVIQMVVVATVLLALAPSSGNVWLYALGLVFVVGYLNSSNFMDGANGMLATYSMIVLLTLWSVAQTPWIPVLSPEGPCGVPEVEGLSACLLAATLVLAIFNVRDRARVFAGDVGSITLGYFIALATLYLGIVYGRPSIVVIVLIFIVDTFVTFVERVLAREHVMKPHCRHLYQRLIAAGYRPTAVASWYALAQGCINAVWLVLPPGAQNIYACTAAVAVTVAYILIKKCVNRKISCR